MEWFTRYGEKHEGKVTEINEDKGTASHSYIDVCSRCGGAGGSDKWKFTGWTCFECNGNGKGQWRTEKLYSADRLAKLNATKAKLDAKRAAKVKAAKEASDAERSARYAEFKLAHAAVCQTVETHFTNRLSGLAANDFIADMGQKLEQFGSLTDAQVLAIEKSIECDAARDAQRAASAFVGIQGKRMDLTLTVEHVILLQSSHYGWAAPCIYLCRDEYGNRIVYKGTGSFIAKGESGKVKATVKSHEDYKGEKQTLISRPVIEKANESASVEAA